MNSYNEYISDLYNNETSSDLIFYVSELVGNKTVNEKRLFAHSFVLSICSPVFEKQFKESKEKEAHRKIIRLCENSVEEFEKFIKFLYQEQYNLKTSNVDGIVRYAKYYEVYDFQKKYGQQIAQLKKLQLLKPDNALDFLYLCVTDNYNYIKPKVIKFIQDDFCCIEYNRECQISIEDILVTTLNFDFKRSYPFCEIELNIFETIMEWIKTVDENADGAAKRRLLGKGLQLIRFPAMTEKSFEACLMSDPGILTDEEIQSIRDNITTGRLNTFGFLDYPRVKLNGTITFQLFNKKSTTFKSVGETKFSTEFSVNFKTVLLGFSMQCPNGRLSISIYNEMNKQLLRTINHYCSSEIDFYSIGKRIELETDTIYKIDYEFSQIEYPSRLIGFESNYVRPSKKPTLLNFFKMSPYIKGFTFTRNVLDLIEAEKAKIESSS